uniref:Zinc finger CCCH domain-containing protein 15 n=2 Tax=Timema TaxID=61471 RepID=A0A7R9GVK5_TIMPO|nr:unnamed protein product [Timema poppensis]
MLRYLWNASAGHLLGYVAENPPPTTEVDIDTVLKALQEVKFVDNVASLDVNDENENTCAEITSKHICQQRIGAVTLVHQHYGFIDKDLYFDFDIFPSHEFRVGDYVKYLAFRKSEQHTWKVQKIYYILNESWDKNDDEDENKNDAEVEEFTKVIPRQSHTRQIVTQVLDRKEREVICSDNIKFDLNSVASEFSPLVNDWIIVEGIVEVDEGVTDFSGELLHIESISALRSRILDGSVTQMDANGEGIIQNEVFFTKHCCETGYIPSVGDFVRVQAIESHQGRLLWRALTVVLFKAAHQGTQSHTSGQDKLTEDKRDELVQDKNGIVLSVNKVKFGNLQIGVYEGFVHKVLQKEIWVKFHSTFHSKYDMSDYRLTFQLSRTYLRRCHAAVNWAIQRLGQEMMFPNKVAPKTQQLIFKETDKDSTASKSFVQVNNVSELKLYTLEENKQLVWFNQRLNFYQKEAVRNILKGEARPLPYVIFGPPGTGKTITLVETIMQLLHLIPHSRLLVATPSNSASNLIAERLVDTGLFLPGQLVRLVSYNLMAKGLLPEKLIPYSTCADITSCDEKTPLEEEPLKLSSNAKTLGRHRVTIGTCSTLGLLHMMAFPHGHFTHVLVDEAGQATEPEILIPLTLINSKTGQVVLAGDPLQLGPVVTSFIAKKYGLGESYLSRLIHRFPYKRDPIGFPNTNGFDPRLVTKLVMNYRSVPEILNLSDSMFYDSELESQVSQTTGPEAELLMSLADILPNRSEDQGPPAIVFQGIRGRNLQEGNCPSWFNPQEVVQTIYYIKKLYAAGLSPDDIGIITPYQRQVQELHSVMSSLSELEALPKIGSVEEFQGQERRVIILSTVRSMVDYVKLDVRHALGFIASPKRLNVALTRAKALLIILGNPHVLGTDPYWRYVLSYIVAHGGYTGCNMPSQFECIDMDSDDSDQNNGRCVARFTLLPDSSDRMKPRSGDWETDLLNDFDKIFQSTSPGPIDDNRCCQVTENDKTFGLKNKKGAKQQRFIQQVEKQVKSGGPNAKKPEDKKLDKEKKLLEQKEMNLLFRPVATQKIEKGADPKSVLCAFFKQGQCAKGDRCKFSHDLTLERKAEKRSLYFDMRDDGEDTMENWDEAKLKEVVEKKQAESDHKMPNTEIICKFFLDAVERSKYGWFWSCPNGSSCIYRHALPPGFVLKKDRKKEEKKDDISLEDLIERERAALGSKLTKVTLETFIAWKKRKLKEKKDAALKEEEKKRNDFKAGKQIGFSGREMFYFNPDLAAADEFEEGDEAFDSYNLQDYDDDNDNVQYREIELDALALEAQEVDGTGTVATEDRLKAAEVNHSSINGDVVNSDEAEDIGGATAVPINENLFLDDEDLDDLDEALDDLDIDQ